MSFDHTHSGGHEHAAAISSPISRTSAYADALRRRICRSRVRMLVTWPTLVRTREAIGQILRHAGMNRRVGREQFFAGGPIQSGVGQFRRGDKSATRKILIPRRARLPVPELLVF